MEMNKKGVNNTLLSYKIPLQKTIEINEKTMKQVPPNNNIINYYSFNNMNNNQMPINNADKIVKSNLEPKTNFAYNEKSFLMLHNNQNNIGYNKNTGLVPNLLNMSVINNYLFYRI